MRITHYTVPTEQPNMNMTAAVVADLHDRPYTEILSQLADIKPDAIFVPGDLCESLEGEQGKHERHGFGFLAEAAKIAPTFYSLGNHEIGASHRQLRHPAAPPDRRGRVHPTWREAIRQTGAILLDEEFISWRGITIGGLGSALHRPDRTPDTAWLQRFAAQKGYKLLLCHHPEYYDRLLRELDIDLVVSGHAHGGQWRICGRGVYAPDQGLFAKYTRGVHEGRLVISAGVANSISPIPRFFNPREIVLVHLRSEETRGQS